VAALVRFVTLLQNEAKMINIFKGWASHAQPTDDSLRIYAVDIWQDPPQSGGPGCGVYLGEGLIITAAHAVTPVAHIKRIADGPARKGHQGGRFQASGSDAPLHRRTQIAYLSADALHAAL
jgi:hypothetical protein